MSNKAQRQLMGIIALALTGAIGLRLRPQLRKLPRVPGQRSIKGDFTEAILHGLVRTATLFVASILVRQLAKSRQ